MLEAGVLLGERYEILQKIGAGGMSIVYLAKCHKLQRHVAIKVLREEFAQDEVFVNKFKAEALSAASLSHPNIVGIYDVGIEEDLKYIVMEYIEGETLKEYLKKFGPFTSEQTLEFGVQIVSAVRHAHKRQIIHRDIKPQNILVTHEHILKVADFGIAKAVDSSTIVATGNAIGSVHYFSPEQAKGRYVSEASDLYSCGIVLFELVTGRLPFESDSHVSVALKHINDPLPYPSTLVPDVSKGLEHIIIKATQKDFEERYQNADKMIDDMKFVLQNPTADLMDVEEISDHTILLTPDQTQLIREGQKSNPEIEKQEPTVEVTESDEQEERISPIYKFLVGLGAVFATLIVLGASIFAWLFWQPSSNQPEFVDVPALLKLTVEEAEVLLAEDELTLVVKESIVDEQLLNGQIVKQDPLAEKLVERGSVISVTVVANPDIEQVEVVDVVGQSIGDAQRALDAAAFTYTVSHAYHNDLEAGKIIEQTPKAGGSVEVGSNVSLVVSNGPETVNVSVPNIYNVTTETAKIALRNAGLQVGHITEKYNDTIMAGYVMSQGVSAGKQVEQGTMIEFVVSLGKEVLEETGTPEEIPNPEDVETPEEIPNPEDTETPDGTEQPLEPEVAQPVTRTHIIRPLENTDKESYHVTVMLEDDNGSEVVFDNTVESSQLPLNIPVTGKGKGTLITFFDSREEYRDIIQFDEEIAQ